MLAESSARRCLARYAELSRELAERVAPLLAVFVAEAGNPDLRALVERAELQRAEGSAGLPVTSPTGSASLPTSRSTRPLTSCGPSPRPRR